jgi:hypothetical protein
MVVAEAVEPEVTDSVGTSGTEPPTTESTDLSVAELPAESLYLPSEFSDGWGIRSVTTFLGNGLFSDGEVSVVELASAEDADVATAAGQMDRSTHCHSHNQRVFP